MTYALLGIVFLIALVAAVVVVYIYHNQIAKKASQVEAVLGVTAKPAASPVTVHVHTAAPAPVVTTPTK